MLDLDFPLYSCHRWRNTIWSGQGPAMSRRAEAHRDICSFLPLSTIIFFLYQKVGGGQAPLPKKLGGSLGPPLASPCSSIYDSCVL